MCNHITTYVIPGYIRHHENPDGILLTSRLRNSKLKLTDSKIKEEFSSIISNNGSMSISTELEQFLHKHKFLLTCKEIERELAALRKVVEKTLIVNIMPTERCNFRCKYCYERHTPTDMTQQTLEKIMEYVGEQAPHFQYVNIGWFGGEPTLCKNMVLVASKFFRSLENKCGFKYRGHMTTNGYLLDENYFRKLVNFGVSSFQITLDGWKHDITRPHVSGCKTLDKIIGNLKQISELPNDQYNFQITLRHNILADDNDYSWYDNLYKLFGKDNRFSIFIFPVKNLRDECARSLNTIKNDGSDILLQKHVEYVKNSGFFCENEQNKLLSDSCYAHYPNSFLFRANGKIEKCTVMLDHPKNMIGYVDTDKGVILDSQRNEAWAFDTLSEKCYTCKNVLYCFNMKCKKDKIIGNLKTTCQDNTTNIWYVNVASAQ